MINRLKRLLVRISASWPGVKGRRAIYDRLARIEGRTLEIQIQLTRRLEGLERRLVIESNKAAARADRMMDSVSGPSPKNLEHQKTVEAALAAWGAQLDSLEASLRVQLNDVASIQKEQLKTAITAQRQQLKTATLTQKELLSRLEAIEARVTPIDDRPKALTDTPSARPKR